HDGVGKCAASCPNNRFYVRQPKDKLRTRSVRHKLKDYVTPLWDLATAVCGWCLLAPLTIFLRRNPDLVVFLGRDGGTYADNCKHLFAAFREQRSGNAKSIFFAKDRELC